VETPRIYTHTMKQLAYWVTKFITTILQDIAINIIRANSLIHIKRMQHTVDLRELHPQVFSVTYIRLWWNNG